MNFKDYYEILGLDRTATKTEIRKAYRKLAKKYHPDSHPDNPAFDEKFKEISEAYEVLSDDDKKAKYDQYGQDFEQYASSDFDPRQYGYASMNFGDMNDQYSDFFNMFFSDDLFGQFSQSRKRGQATKQNVEATLDVTLEEVYHGGSKSFRLDHDSKMTTVKIPKGIQSGKKLRLKGKGYGSSGSSLGDLILTIIVKDDKKVKRDKLNLTMSVTLYPWEAYLGCHKVVELFGQKIEVKFPKQIHNGQKIRLQDKGLSTAKGHHGHLFLEVKIDNPKDFSLSEGDKYYRELEKAYEGRR